MRQKNVVSLMAALLVVLGLLVVLNNKYKLALMGLYTQRRNRIGGGHLTDPVLIGQTLIAGEIENGTVNPTKLSPSGRERPRLVTEPFNERK